jgi:caffeoyl-CoA O-methyltransferase
VTSQEYIERLFAPQDAHLEAIREAMEREGLPEIQLPPITARTLQFLLGVVEARRVLEVGTLAGYSALWIARAFQASGQVSGRLVTLELDAGRARLARELLDRAGVGDRVEIRVGDAATLLPELGPAGSFDAVFLDADKEGIPRYVEEARRLLRPGGLLLVDNALWKGKVPDPSETDPATEAIRESHRVLAADPDFDAMLLPVGDGLLVARYLG